MTSQSICAFLQSFASWKRHCDAKCQARQALFHAKLAGRLGGPPLLIEQGRFEWSGILTDHLMGNSGIHVVNPTIDHPQ